VLNSTNNPTHDDGNDSLMERVEMNSPAMPYTLPAQSQKRNWIQSTQSKNLLNAERRLIKHFSGQPATALAKWSMKLFPTFPLFFVVAGILALIFRNL
jgi:hypothetical protein